VPRSIRILVGLGETAGYCAGLAEGLRAAGAAADHLNLGTDPMSYSGPPSGRLVRAVRWLGHRRRAGPGPRSAWVVVHRLAMAWLFLIALARYDAFIFRAGDSFFALRDLPLLRRLNKAVVIVFFGTDSRPSYLSGSEIASGQDGTEAAASTAAKRRMVARIERHATDIVCHPMSAQLHRRTFVAFLEVGIPRRRMAASAPMAHPGPVRFLHAPSRLHDKGTDLIERAVAAVSAEGIDVELRVLTGRPNAEILAAIAECDVVIDQLYSDTPMAALAAEAASLGRPAIVGGYGWEALRAMTSQESMPPAHLCRPEEIVDAIRRLATDAAYRADLGLRARRFLEDRWLPERVGRRYLTLLAGDAPAEWSWEPQRTTYVHGAGAPEDQLRASVARVLEACGTAGLHLEDKPHLVEALVGLAAEAEGVTT
jgi:glycosyltransferase involved in cell wall biosynthesis